MRHAHSYLSPSHNWHVLSINRTPQIPTKHLTAGQQPGAIECGTYLIKTTHHAAGAQPAGWGLACFPKHGAKRNDGSSWVHVHEGDHWPCRWEIRPGQQPGTYRIYTCGHADGGQEAGWGLSAWHAHGAERNGGSSWVAVHNGEKWPMDWLIVPGKQPNTWRFLTTHHAAGQQPEGWGLSAWNAHGAKRNDVSSRVAVHEGDHWPMDWVLERVGAIECGTYPGKTDVDPVRGHATCAHVTFAPARDLCFTHSYLSPCHNWLACTLNQPYAADIRRQ